MDDIESQNGDAYQVVANRHYNHNTHNTVVVPFWAVKNWPKWRFAVLKNLADSLGLTLFHRKQTDYCLDKWDH